MRKGPQGIVASRSVTTTSRGTSPQFLIVILKLGQFSLKPIHGLILLAAYLVYLVYLFATMGKLREPTGTDFYKPVSRVRVFRSLYTLDLPEMIVGKREIHAGNAWILLLISTAVMSFGTWLLVVFLSIITLGIYIPWAYCRIRRWQTNNQYFADEGDIETV